MQDTTPYLVTLLRRARLPMAVALIACLCAVPSVRADDERSSDEAFTKYTQGVFLLETESAEAALPYLVEAWEGSGRDAGVGQKLAEVYWELRRIDDCRDVVDHILTAEPQNRDAKIMRGKVAYVQGDREKAVQLFQETRNQGRASFEVEQLLGKTLLELGREEEALEAYANAIAIDSNQPYLYFLYAQLLIARDRTDDALEALNNAIQLEPRFADAVFSAVDVLTKEKRLPEAQQMLESFLETEPGNAETVLMLSDMYLEQDQPQRAITILTELGEEAQLPEEGIMLLGRAHYQAEEFDKSLSVFEQVFRGQRRTSSMARVLAEIASRARDTESARNYYQTAIELGPEDYKNYMALFLAGSEAFVEEPQAVIPMEEAENLELLGKAASLVDGNDFEANFLIGVSYQSVEALDEARRFLRRAVDLAPEHARARLNLASVLEKLDRYDEAEVHVGELHKLTPEDPTVCNFYGYLLALMGKDLDKAESLIRTALNQDPENGYYTDSLGWVFFKRGEYAKAVSELERASELVGEDPIVLEHLGDAYAALDRHDDALSAYERSSVLQDDNDELRGKIKRARKNLSN